MTQFSAERSAAMPLRLLVSIIILLAAMLVVFIFLLATDTALSVWNYLRLAPAWLQLAYLCILLILPLATLVFFWSWFRPKKTFNAESKPKPVNFQQLQEDLLDSQQAGVDVSPALAEIREQRRRKDSGEIHIAIFGEVSSGKSSLVKALLPQAEIERDARAGTTRTITQYRWTAASGDQVLISDLPGFNFDDNAAAREETRRAHLVIFLCDGDLSASQAEQLKALVQLDKPLVLALNKSDRFSEAERQIVLQRLQQRSGLPAENVVSISAGGKQEVVRMLGEGMERREERERPAEIEDLLRAVQRLLDQDRELMESLRDTSILLLANEKLELARRHHREQQA
ncbi:MAG TPA: GTPase, partial [Xanthomonadales bacterium]|nr:GTPase [Xanthomonadales bacterium]